MVSYKHVLLLLLMVCLSSQAVSEQADEDIRAAIRVAILDGLTATDLYIREKYWYYVRGSERVSFNVTVLPTKLNYILVYKLGANVYRVNTDLDKIDWEPKINNFVRIEGV
jgi:hypothetical protein